MTVNAQGYCLKHGEPLPKVDGPNGVTCLLCEGKESKQGPLRVTTEDPGEDKLRALLASQGIAVGKSKPVEKKENKNIVAPAISVEPNDSFDAHIQNALKIISNLPIPKDLKQFKKINKVIKDLKSLLGEQNA